MYIFLYYWYLKCLIRVSLVDVNMDVKRENNMYYVYSINLVNKCGDFICSLKY